MFTVIQNNMETETVVAVMMTGAEDNIIDIQNEELEFRGWVAG